MTTGSTERMNPWLRIVSFLAEEAGGNEVDKKGPSQRLNRLVTGLIRQVPNRVYVSSSGLLVGKVLFYKGDPSYYAYCEVSKPGRDSWKELVDTRYLACEKLDDLEEEIIKLRHYYDLRGDLVEHPDVVKRVTSNTGISFEFLHRLAGTTESVFYHYSLSVSHGPRAFEIGNKVPGLPPLEDFGGLSYRVPTALVAYANPFTSSFPPQD